MKTLEAQVGQFLLGCKCPVSWGIVMQEQDSFGNLLACGVYPSKCPSIAPAKMRSVILCIDSLALWKMINAEDAILIQKNQGENFSSRFLHSEFFWAG
jgi:hypothetical protein